MPVSREPGGAQAPDQGATQGRWGRCVSSRRIAALPGSLRLGEPVTSGPLVLVPVFGGHPAPTYRLAAEAIADCTLSIGEIGGGQVPQLGVRNVGELPALLVEGEHLHGAMQDRVLNVTVLVPAKADTEIPVSCVEQVRGSEKFLASIDRDLDAVRTIERIRP
jgi:hypothetical protein